VKRKSAAAKSWHPADATQIAMAAPLQFEAERASPRASISNGGRTCAISGSGKAIFCVGCRGCCGRMGNQASQHDARKVRALRQLVSS